MARVPIFIKDLKYLQNFFFSPESDVEYTFYGWNTEKHWYDYYRPFYGSYHIDVKHKSLIPQLHKTVVYIESNLLF